MDRPIAKYATQATQSRGRVYAERGSRRRSPFQRDRDRIIHATAFRRLKHKTQVFIAPEGDHFRTRLTHSLEVSQIARALSRTLRLDEDLAEALGICLVHGRVLHAEDGEDVAELFFVANRLVDGEVMQTVTPSEGITAGGAVRGRRPVVVR